jgi:hypothetical protein
VSELVMRFVSSLQQRREGRNEEASSSRRFMGKYGFAMKNRKLE